MVALPPRPWQTQGGVKGPRSRSRGKGGWGVGAAAPALADVHDVLEAPSLCPGAACSGRAPPEAAMAVAAGGGIGSSSHFGKRSLTAFADNRSALAIVREPN